MELAFMPLVDLLISSSVLAGKLTLGLESSLEVASQLGLLVILQLSVISCRAWRLRFLWLSGLFIWQLLLVVSRNLKLI